MRTAMPLLTCSRMTLRSESASSLSISTPRLIGPGMHDDGLGVEPGGAGLVEAEHAGVFAERGKVAGGLALVLDAQEHDDLGVGERGLEVVRDLHAEGGEPVRHEGGGADERDVGLELGERPDVGAGDAAEEDVAEDHDLAALQRAEVLLHREGVEQRLGRMLVGAVAGVDHRDVEQAAEVERRAGGGVAQHDHVGVERLDVLRGVAQGLALGGAGGGGVEGDDVGAEPLGGHLERHAGAGARLEEEVDDRLAAQRGHLLHAALEDLLERRGGRVDLVDLGAAQFLDGDQVVGGSRASAEVGAAAWRRRGRDVGGRDRGWIVGRDRRDRGGPTTRSPSAAASVRPQ